MAADSITFLGYEIKDGKWSLEGFISRKMQEIGSVDSIKGLERVIGILSYARRCIKNTEKILGPLREDLRSFKSGSVTDVWKAEMNCHVREAFEKALDNVEWLVLPGVDVGHFTFVVETDWSSGCSGYMLFACSEGEEKLVDLGSRSRLLATSSYLGELDAVIWACKRTKAFRGSVPLVIRTDSYSLYSKAKSGNFYDADVRAFRRWEWLLANEPDFNVEFVPGKTNIGADLLSRPVENQPARTVSTINVSQEVAQKIWSEHLKSHWGAFKTYKALRRQGVQVTWSMVKDICNMCEICMKFKEPVRHLDWGQPPFSLVPGHTLFADVLGPLVPGRGGVRYVQCVIDSVSRLSMAFKMKSVSSEGVIQGFERWISKHGPIRVFVTDNASYYSSEMMDEWCKEHNVRHIFAAPYRHQSMGWLRDFIELWLTESGD